MKFGDEELTGKELGPVRFSFNNDAAKQHIGLARRYLGDMKQRMQLGNLGQLYEEKTLKDGSIIRMWSNKNGLADIDLIDISSPSEAGVKTSKKYRCLGFVANSYLDRDSPFGFTEVRIKNPFGEDYEYLLIDGTDENKIAGLDSAYGIQGAIANTIEVDPNAFFYRQEEDLWNGVRFFWITGSGSLSGCTPFGQYTGSVGPYSPQDVDDHNNSQPALIPAPVNLSSDDWTGKYQFSITRRNSHKHIGMFAKPIITSSGIQFARHLNNSFISVLPGKTNYIPVTSTWNEYVSVYGSEIDTWDQPVLVTGGYLTQATCDYPLNAYLGPWNGNDNYSVYFSTIESRSANTITSFTVENATVPSGVYIVRGSPNVVIWLLLDELDEKDSIINRYMYPVRFKNINPFEHNIHVNINGSIIDEPESIVSKVRETNVFTYEEVDQNNARFRWTIEPAN